MKMAASRIQESKESVSEEIARLFEMGLIKKHSAPDNTIKNYEEAEE